MKENATSCFKVSEKIQGSQKKKPVPDNSGTGFKLNKSKLFSV